MIEDRRQFNRVDFATIAHLDINQQTIECQISDLSLHGALITLNEQIKMEVGQICRLQVPLGDNSACITMELELTRIKGNKIGAKCSHIDLDSITHLRRLIELNLGDAHLLERDFEALVE